MEFVYEAYEIASRLLPAALALEERRDGPHDLPPDKGFAMTLTCFTSYDIRGRLGVDLDAQIAFRIGRGFARALGAKVVVVGRDCRASSAELAGAAFGLCDLHRWLAFLSENYLAALDFQKQCQTVFDSGCRSWKGFLCLYPCPCL
jgi:hypothetical protein